MDLQIILNDIEEENEIIIFLALQNTLQRRRNLWVHPINRRRLLDSEYHRLMPLLLEDDERFITYFRLNRSQYYYLLNLISPEISRKNTRFRECIPPDEKLAVCLRYLATGNSFRSLGFSFRMEFSTVGGIIKECTRALWLVLQPLFMVQPNEEDWKIVAKGFEEKWNFPHCIGALDGKHVQMRCPYNSGSEYFNYKGTHSIVLMALVDHNYKFRVIDVGAYGRNSDGGTWERSALGNLFNCNQLQIPPPDNNVPGYEEQLPYVLVADEAFPLKPNLMRPYSRNSITHDEHRIYNYRHSRVRRVVENAFGILAGRWRIFLKPMEVQPAIADYIILSACVLHNFLRGNTNITSSFEDRISVPMDGVAGFNALGGIRRNPTREAIFVREMFRDYFVSASGTASCPWQWASIRP